MTTAGKRIIAALQESMVPRWIDARMQPLEVGHAVEKVDGVSRFPGVIVAKYLTLSGHPRVVVECTLEGCRGLQHIYRPDQLRRVDSGEEDGTAGGSSEAE